MKRTVSALCPASREIFLLHQVLRLPLYFAQYARYSQTHLRFREFTAAEIAHRLEVYSAYIWRTRQRKAEYIPNLAHIYAGHQCWHQHDR